MKEKRITMAERISGPSLEGMIESGAWRLLGAMWKKWIEVYVDMRNGDLVIRYE